MLSAVRLVECTMMLQLRCAGQPDAHVAAAMVKQLLGLPVVSIFAVCRELLTAMAAQAMQRLQHFNSQNISNTLWAFASLNHHPGPMLLKVLQRELVHKLRQFTPQGIENVLWAFATLGHHPGKPTDHLHLHA